MPNTLEEFNFFIPSDILVAFFLVEMKLSFTSLLWEKNLCYYFLLNHIL